MTRPGIGRLALRTGLLLPFGLLALLVGELLEQQRSSSTRR